MGKRFKFLTGDINWRQYGGTFYHKEETCKGSGEYVYTILEVINFHDAMDSNYKNQYGVEVKTICLDMYSDDKVNSALECCGWLDDNQPVTELQMLEAMVSYGYGDLEVSLEGNNIKKLMREARAYC